MVRTDPVNPLSRRQLPAETVGHCLQPVQIDSAGIDGFTPRWFFRDDRHIHIAIGGEGEGARDRRCRHYQDIDTALAITPLGAQGKALMHAEAVLLVDNGETEVVEFYILLKERMGTDHKINRATCQFLKDGGAFLALEAARNQQAFEPR